MEESTKSERDVSAMYQERRDPQQYWTQSNMHKRQFKEHFDKSPITDAGQQTTTSWYALSIRVEKNIYYEAIN